ncbi:hypothetical protein [Azospirillum agricola]|uniref:hypothetical protein n=1 Tax=Azospirillum agricola TaxID=1720247 RepID=UPI000A0F1CD1|nr:hypothetical protein [Azospirillum agricola]SMH60477.1 hypothetical protein SAMN02982994_5517 [Azospirillum lipoferum]
MTPSPVFPMSRAKLLELADVTHPHLKPLVLAAAHHRIFFGTVLQHAGRFDPPPAARPFVLLVGDDMFETLGPAAFHSKSLRRVLAGATHVGINAANIQAGIYARAAELAAAGGRVVLVECRPETEREWLAFAGRHAPAADKLVSTPNVASYARSSGRA